MSDIRPSTEGLLDDLRSELSERLALVAAVGGGLIMWQSLVTQPFPTAVFTLATALLCLAGAVLWLRRRRPKQARFLLVWGLAAIVLAGFPVVPGAAFSALAILVIFVATLLVPGSGFAIAAAVSALVIWQSTAGDQAQPWPGLVLALAAGAVVAWLSARTLYTAIGWAYTMQQRADHLLDSCA